MSPSQLVVVLSNLEPTATVLVLEELAITALDSGLLQPMILSPVKGFVFHSGDWDPNSKNPWKKTVKRTVWGTVPFLQSDHWASVLTSAKTPETTALRDSTLYFLPIDEEALSTIPDTVGSILFLLKSDTGAASFMYRAFRKLSERCPQLKNSYAVIYGVPHIEKAAIEFGRLKSETEAILSKGIQLSFISHIAPLEEKIKAARYPYLGSLVRVFPGDGFQGQLKHVAQKLQKLVTPSQNQDVSSLAAWVDTV